MIWACCILVASLILYAGWALPAYISRLREERRAREDNAYYVMCVPGMRDAGKGYLWSGPYPTETEAQDEIADSRRLVGKKDVLYVVDKKSYPPPKP